MKTRSISHVSRNSLLYVVAYSFLLVCESVECTVRIFRQVEWIVECQQRLVLSAFHSKNYFWIQIATENWYFHSDGLIEKYSINTRVFSQLNFQWTFLYLAFRCFEIRLCKIPTSNCRWLLVSCKCQAPYIRSHTKHGLQDIDCEEPVIK